jgi:sorbitol-specific phosphotransferase system component IIC
MRQRQKRWLLLIFNSRSPTSPGQRCFTHQQPTHSVTNATGQSCRNQSFLSYTRIPRISWNTKVTTAFQTACHLSLSSATSIQSTLPILFTLILSSYLSLGLQSDLFPHQNPVYTSPLPLPTHPIWSLAANLNSGDVWLPYALQFSFTCSCCQHTKLNLRIFIFASALHTAADLT